MTDARLDALAARLPRHAAILHELLAALRRDPAWRWLELGCSMALGHGDEFSDLDLGLGVAEDAWPAALERVPAILGDLGEVVGMLHHRIGEWGDAPHRRTFVQYADGVQIDLVAMPAGRRTGLPPGNMALYDADGRLSTAVTPSIITATADDIHEWAFLGWTALADLDKYLRRGSLWEALARLQEARQQVWRLWAAAHDVAYPTFGLTAVLDEPVVGVPPGMEETVAALEARDLRRAASACARLLDDVSQAAATRHGGAVPHRLSRYVTRRLEMPDASGGG